MAFLTPLPTKIKAPCKDCKERSISCHSRCDKYISYRKEYDEINEKYREYKKASRLPDRTTELLALKTRSHRVTNRELARVNTKYKTKRK